MMNCPICGKDITPDALFCVYCGSKLAELTPPEELLSEEVIADVEESVPDMDSEPELTAAPEDVIPEVPVPKELIPEEVTMPDEEGDLLAQVEGALEEEVTQTLLAETSQEIENIPSSTPVECPAEAHDDADTAPLPSVPKDVYVPEEMSVSKSANTSGKLPKKSIGFPGGCKIFLFSLLLIILMVAFLGVTSIRQLRSERAVSGMVESIELTDLEIEGKELPEYIADKITRDVDAKDVEYMLERLEYEEFVSDLALQYSDYLLGDGHGLRLNVDDIMDVVEANEQVIEEELGFELTDAKKQDVRNYLEKHKDEYQDAIDQTIGRDSFVDEHKDILGLVFSAATMWIIVALMAVLLFAWIMTFRKKSYLHRGFCGYGSLMLVFSGLLTIALVFCKYIIELVDADLLAYWGVITAVKVPLLNSSLMLVGAGAVILITGLIMRAVVRKKLIRQ